MKIENFEDFVQLVSHFTDTDTKDKSETFIQAEGLSKFKDSLYEVIQYVEDEDNILLKKEDLSYNKQLLFESLKKFTKEQRDSISQAMLTSYYTPNHIVKTISDNLDQYWSDKNLTHIKICEPSAGTGKFVKALMAGNRQIDAVELDYFTAKILENNFSSPNVHIINKGFENHQPSEYYDAIVGNVPFGSYGVYDKNLTSKEKTLCEGKIHNYFFIKSLNSLKPGGILMLMTTSSMSDSRIDKEFREHLVEQANLISCIRFDDNTFEKSKTKVVSDLLIFQKPLEPKKIISEREKLYIDTSIHIESIDFSMVNDFFKEYPSHVLGQFYISRGHSGREILSVRETKNKEDLKIELDNLIRSDFEKYGLKRLLDINIDFNEKGPINKDEINNTHKSIIKEYPLAVPGNIIMLDNNFFKIIKSETSVEYLDKVPFSCSDSDKERLLNLIQIRETYKFLRDELRNNNFQKAKYYQDKLEEQYNIFSFFFDTINSKRNELLLVKEVESDLLRGLEILQNKEYVKSQIFTKDFSISKEEDLSINNIKDAIALSFHKFGKLKESYIDEIYNSSREQWIKEALDKEILYINPIMAANHTNVDNFELAIPSRFKSGYIEWKLSIYNNEALLIKNNIYAPFLQKGIIENSKKVLLDTMPFKLSISEINPSLGEPWIDNKVYELFGKEHFKEESFKINYIPVLDIFKVISKDNSYGNTNYAVESPYKFVTYQKIFEYALSHNIPEFKKTIVINGIETKIADKKTISAVNQSIEKLNKEFNLWLLNSSEISKRLENKYHMLNNAIVKEDYNLSLFNFDDLVGMTPYDHQKNCVWQNVMQLGGIIDHEVGFGKSLTMAMTTMTKVKFNLIKKELVVGMNANYVSLYMTYKNCYPNGKFLLVTPDDLEPKKKQTTFYKIANNDWDAIITAHSCLKKFPIAPYAQKEILEENIRDISITIKNGQEERLLSRGQVNDLNKRLINAEAKYQYALDIINEKKEKGTLIFDDLKIDSLTIDESHEFKNLSFTTKHSRVAGLGNQSEVQKTTNLLSYIRYIQNHHKEDKGITFASGTTISNSITELYLLFKYLRPRALHEKGMNTFDQWARVYARKTTEYEEGVTGSIKQKERFRFFVKVPELAKIYNDVTNYADFNTFKIERPLGKVNLIPIEPYPEQLAYFEKIKEFGKTKDINVLNDNSESKGSVNSKAVGLICTNLGRKASLSLKLINSDFPDHPNDKINTMVRHLLDYHQKFKEDKGVQLIFCDQGVPGSVNYNLYQYTKDKLINSGLKENEIAFIHDWEKRKQALYDKVNDGEIRIVLGSTTKMGVGVNMQKRIVALHHLDFPWRPTDLQQRNGRGERPGNIILPKYNNTIEINFYATKQSLDAYTFNLLQIKNNFILQIKNASIHTRVIDEGLIDNNGGMNFQEYMAACSSNQYLTQRLEVEKKLNTLLDVKSGYELRFRQNASKLSFIEDSIVKYSEILEKLKSDKVSANKLQHDMYNNIKFNDFKESAKYLIETLNKYLKCKPVENIPFISVGNPDNKFNLILRPKNKELPLEINNYSIFLQTPNNYKIGYKSGVFTKNEKEVATYAYNCINRLDDLIIDYSKKLKENLHLKELIENSNANKFDKEEKIISLKEQLKELDNLIEKDNKKEIQKEDQDPQEKQKIFKGSRL